VAEIWLNASPRTMTPATPASAEPMKEGVGIVRSTLSRAISAASRSEADGAHRLGRAMVRLTSWLHSARTIHPRC